MKKIKNLFSTPKKAIITILVAVFSLTAIGFGTAFTVSAFAESSSIGAENAQNFAFADANVDPVDAKVTETKFKFEQGQFVYDVEFIADDIEYEYWVRASDGAIVKKSSENIVTGEEGPVSSDRITLDQAKETALEDAGLKSSDVTYTKAKLDYDNTTAMYEIEFYTATHKYEYEINASANTVYSKSKETLKNTSANSSNSSQNGDKTNTSSDDKKQNSNQSSNNTSQNNNQTANNNSQSNNQSSNNNTQNNNKPANNNSNSGNKSSSTSSYISVDSAKKAALNNAGLSSSQVKYTKAKLDYDDGVAVYEIEFYTSSNKYEYEINAKTGKVISKDIDPIKNSSGSSSGGNTDSGYIGVDKAKSIAVNHAGFSVSSVTFSKAKLESDDGRKVYEVEFYKNHMEYEYTINATTGAIIEYDSDYDD